VRAVLQAAERLHSVACAHLVRDKVRVRARVRARVRVRVRVRARAGLRAWG